MGKSAVLRCIIGVRSQQKQRRFQIMAVQFFKLGGIFINNDNIRNRRVAGIKQIKIFDMMAELAGQVLAEIARTGYK